MELDVQRAASADVKYVVSLRTQIADLLGELEKAEASFEQERDRADKLAAELMVSKEVVVRLEGELIVLRTQNLWQRLFSIGSDQGYWPHHGFSRWMPQSFAMRAYQACDQIVLKFIQRNRRVFAEAIARRIRRDRSKSDLSSEDLRTRGGDAPD
jgi:hypothetical protein